jgi:hypothetical protein
VSSGPSLPQVLVESLRARLRREQGGSALEQAVRAAAEPDRDRRAWALVALATRLRREGEGDVARLAVHGALTLDAGAEPTRAAYVCAVALHADEGDLATAVKVGEELLADGYDVALVRTMARVYWALWKQTRDEDWHERWWGMHVRLHEPGAART